MSRPLLRTSSRWWGTLCLLCLLCSLGLLAACARSPGGSGAATGSDAAGGKTLLRGGGPDPDSLDPQKLRGFEAQTILRDLCEGLTILDHAGGAAPGGATSWAVSSDGLTWTFHLRREARWSTGDPVVAADYVAGLTRLVDPATASANAQYIGVIANASDIVAGRKPPASLGVVAPDEHTVVISLASPAPYLPALLTRPCTCPVHRATLAQHPGDYARAGVMPANGAFVLADWLQGSYVLLRRNHYYWNDAATRLAAVKYLIIPDENAELTRYRSGELHITVVVPRGQFDWIRSHLPGELHISPQLTTYYYGFNLRRAPFAGHPGLRRALSMVIDRDRLARLVLRVGELPAWGWVPPQVAQYTPQSFDYRSMPLSARIAEARRLYAQAGYSEAHPLSFELRYNAGEVHTKVAVAVASMWKQALGAQVRLTQVEFKTLLSDIDRGDVQMFRSSWVGDYNDANAFAEYFKSDYGVNLVHYNNPHYDALVHEAAQQRDTSRRRALLEEAERVLLADTPAIPLYFYVNKHLVKPQVLGWYDNVMNVVYSKDLGLR
ncbi:MAG: peptide ABC transporter substrate-binding protein [Proteobacteria bacterium]|nr:peptide ABC transporter substrate-binding protein [Pseudomonadota bacterium]